jgi:sRNA-binding regulator protein Hfq
VGSDSTLYTIGTALNRALDNELPVELLVGGIWMAGTVAAVDGFGVVLSSRDSEHAVVRVEAIAAVRIAAAAPQRTPIATGARPMPGPNGFQH